MLCGHRDQSLCVDQVSTIHLSVTHFVNVGDRPPPEIFRYYRRDDNIYYNPVEGKRSIG